VVNRACDLGSIKGRAPKANNKRRKGKGEIGRTARSRKKRGDKTSLSREKKQSPRSRPWRRKNEKTKGGNHGYRGADAE